jgi:hypothetical protein
VLAFHPDNSFCFLSAPSSIVTADRKSRNGTQEESKSVTTPHPRRAAASAHPEGRKEDGHRPATRERAAKREAASSSAPGHQQMGKHHKASDVACADTRSTRSTRTPSHGKAKTPLLASVLHGSTAGVGLHLMRHWICEGVSV